ncbi:hypothetical protein RyT2_27610 [Pseudolactococcus yaeyamensis]
MVDTLPEEIELEFVRKKSQNGIAYKNNNDETKVIRVGIPAWQTFTSLAKSQGKNYKEMFNEIVAYYVENSGRFSDVQPEIIDKKQEKKNV